jgi:hypothetical protein
MAVMGTQAIRRGTLVLAVAALSLAWPAAAWGAPSANSAGGAASASAQLSKAPVGATRFKFATSSPLSRPSTAASRVGAAANGPNTTSFPSGVSAPFWTFNENYPAGNNYQDSMLGGSPFAAGAGTTTISTPIIPVKIVTSGGTKSDASATASDCSQTKSAAALTQLSPIFQNEVPDPEGHLTQLIDAYERGNFNQQTQTSGISPNYHLLLSSSVGSTLTITVPTADVIQFTGPTCGTLTAVDSTWWNSNFPGIVSNLNDTSALDPHTMPLFVLYNSVLCNVSASCSTGVTGGYHNFLNDTWVPGPMMPGVAATQIYGVYDYDLTGDLPAIDTGIMSHEVAEAVSDPMANNPVPTWGYIGQDQGRCQPNFEPGDPLTTGFTGSPGLVADTYSISSTSYTFHVQDLAYHSWFFRETSPPTSVNVATTLGSGKYSMFGDFASGSSSTVCPGQPTGVTAVPGNGSATISWTAGPGPVDSYYLAAYHNGSLLGAAGPLSTSPTVVNLGSLTNGTSYTFTIIAAHANSSSPYCLLNNMMSSLGTGHDCSTESLPSNTIIAGTPIAPTGVSASAVSGGAKVSWTAPASNNGSPITGYVVTPYLNGVALAPDTFNSTATTETVTGLTKGSNYTFTVAAINGNGTGIPSGQSNSVAPK